MSYASFLLEKYGIPVNYGYREDLKNFPTPTFKRVNHPETSAIAKNDTLQKRLNPRNPEELLKIKQLKADNKQKWNQRSRKTLYMIRSPLQ